LRGDASTPQNFFNISQKFANSVHLQHDFPLPLANRYKTYLMTDSGKCLEPGLVCYIEFNLSDATLELLKILGTIDKNFTENSFVFYLNVFFFIKL